MISENSSTNPVSLSLFWQPGEFCGRDPMEIPIYIVGVSPRTERKEKKIWWVYVTRLHFYTKNYRSFVSFFNLFNYPWTIRTLILVSCECTKRYLFTFHRSLTILITIISNPTFFFVDFYQEKWEKNDRLNDINKDVWSFNFSLSSFLNDLQ
jgi:hypothetical protein